MDCTLARPKRQRSRQKPEIGLVPILDIDINAIFPSPENDKLYKPVDPDDPGIRELAKSIREHGIKEPLIVTKDGYIISGHRRFAAARLAGLEICTVSRGAHRTGSRPRPFRRAASRVQPPAGENARRGVAQGNRVG